MNIDAMAALLNQSFAPSKIIAKVAVKERCLTLVLQSTAPTDKEIIIDQVLTQILTLELGDFEKIRICGQQKNTFDYAWKAEFKPTKISQFEFSDNELGEALKQCYLTAYKAYHKSLTYAEQARSILWKLNHEISTETYYSLKGFNLEKFEFVNIIEGISVEIENICCKGMQEFQQSLETKGQHLQDFTIALFGRTKAGKSTIREALTNGDGHTIGKGKQRTTRSIHEYSWNGLCLVDTPGIEAYKGEEDTRQANEAINQADLVIFLVSDDSVQPGEFEELARLNKIKKSFLVILNVKHNIHDQAHLEMLLDMPEIVFDEARLDEHRNHICTFIKKELKKTIQPADIICIHAMAAFLSTRPEYLSYSERLWEISRLNEVYRLISEDIINNGKARRITTLIGSSLDFIQQITDSLSDYRNRLDEQNEFVGEKRKELKRLFENYLQDGESRIERECRLFYSSIKQWIPHFVDSYAGEKDAEAEWQRKTDAEQLKVKMQGVMQELSLDLQEQLQEFTNQYQYDLTTIKIEMKDIDFSGIEKGNFGGFVRKAGLVLGGLAAAAFIAANWWNPAGWVVATSWIATGTGIACGFAGDWKSNQESKDFSRQSRELKKKLLNTVDQHEQKAISAYKSGFSQYIKSSVFLSVENQLTGYQQGLSKIVDLIDKSISRMKTLIREIEKDLVNQNH